MFAVYVGHGNGASQTGDRQMTKVAERLAQIHKIIGAVFVSKSGNICDVGCDILNNLEDAEAAIAKNDFAWATEIMDKAEAAITENVTDTGAALVRKIRAT
jgi:hypothetical protein